MGGRGSGRPTGKPLVEHSLVLDIGRIAKAGLLKAGRIGEAQIDWWAGETSIAHAHCRIDLTGSSRHTMYLQTHLHGQFGAAEFDQAISLERTHPNFGGSRWWLVCPQTDKRGQKLYLPLGGNRFASRAAWRLAYRSQRLTGREARMDRWRAIYEEVYRESPDGFPQKPKGMWGRTFDQRLALLERRSAGIDVDFVQILSGREDKSREGTSSLPERKTVRNGERQ